MAPVTQNVKNSHKISLAMLHFCDLLFLDRACSYECHKIVHAENKVQENKVQRNKYLAPSEIFFSPNVSEKYGIKIITSQKMLK